ncbi:DUF2721 domain-containing protein [Scytonema sp. NUACC26]|uniref:DUF2721 domain-containing protein n=1 Tax=Scytonema sp. NUACC26 TaxID=3140176 RepID=UPI0034DBD86A
MQQTLRVGRKVQTCVTRKAKLPMNDLTKALAILSAMIAPAVLISACGTLILTTSQRVARTIDRTRKVSAQFEQLVQAKSDGALLEERRAVLFNQIGIAARRSRLLQRALSCLYITLSIFVATSVTIGIVAVFGLEYTWIPILLGIMGVGLLFYTSLLLIIESRVAIAAVNEEMDFVLRLEQCQAPVELLKRQKARGKLFRSLYLTQLWKKTPPS